MNAERKEFLKKFFEERKKLEDLDPFSEGLFSSKAAEYTRFCLNVGAEEEILYNMSKEDIML